METATKPAIKLNEFRIGNWFENDLGKYYQVNPLAYPVCLHDTEWRAKNMQPIPLTPELLEKCGFEDDSPDQFSSAAFLLEKDNDEYLPLTCDSWQPFANRIKYLHQLQNLHFALTGEELTINL